MSASPTTRRPATRPAPTQRPAPRAGHALSSGRPHLRVIEGGLLRYQRRQRALHAIVAAVAGLLVVGALWLVYVSVGAAMSSRTVEAGGTAVVAPGETLWDVATTHAPAGTDPRAYLEDLRDLNTTEGPIEPWTVVRLPATR